MLVHDTGMIPISKTDDKLVFRLTDKTFKFKSAAKLSSTRTPYVLADGGTGPTSQRLTMNSS